MFRFQSNLEIVGPAVEFVSLGFEVARVVLGDVALDGGLAALGKRVECFLNILSRLRVLGGYARRGEQAFRGFFLQRLAIISDWREDEVVFRLIERFHTETRKGEPAGLVNERLQGCDFAVMLAVVKSNSGCWEVAVLRLCHQGFSTRLVEAVEVRFTGTARQFMQADGMAAECCGKGCAVRRKEASPRNSA